MSSADALTVTSRNFYESNLNIKMLLYFSYLLIIYQFLFILIGTRAKVAISLVIAAGGLMLLGWCAVSGGLSTAYVKV